MKIDHLIRCILYGFPIIIYLDVITKIIMSYSDQKYLENILLFENIEFVFASIALGLIGFILVIRSIVLDLPKNKSHLYDYMLLSFFLSFVLFSLLMPFTTTIIFLCSRKLLMIHREREV